MINRFVFTTFLSCLFSFGLPLHSQDTKVVEVSLAAEPQKYGGSCPVKIRFTGWILTSGPGPVSFQFERSDSWVGEVRTEEVILKTNRLEVSMEWDFEGLGDQYDGWVALHTLKPNEVISDKAAFSIGCTNATGSAEEAKRRAWEESQKTPSGDSSATAEEEKRKAIEEPKAGEQFIPCPLDEVQTQMVTALPQPWWITPQIGKLVDTRIDTVGGKRTLICNYWAYARSVPVMREFPAGTNCRAADNGFFCWEELQQPSAEEEENPKLINEPENAPAPSAPSEKRPATPESGETFSPCPLKEARTDVVTPLPEPWFATPHVGKLLGTRIDMIGGKKTLICDYWAYSRSVAAMREMPIGLDCRPDADGFYCRPPGAEPPSTNVENQPPIPAGKNLPGKIPPKEPAFAPDLNFDFEDGLNYWTPEGSAFNNQPVVWNPVLTDRVMTQMSYDNGGIGGDYWKGMPFPVGFHAGKWIGTYENGNGNEVTGSLTSTAFQAGKRYLHFLMGGGKDLNRIYVELQVKKSDYEAAWGSGRNGFYGDTDDGFTRVNRLTPLINSEELFRYWFDLDSELNHQPEGKTIRVCIVDNSSTDRGHINADDFRQSDDIGSFLVVRRGGFTLYADPSVPVWGFFDTHAHPAAQESFGKKLVIGNPIEPMSECYSTNLCIGYHSIGGRDSNNNDALTANLSRHVMRGWPDLLFFPRFNDLIHQKYHVDFIKRAWQGGLRLMSALSVNNMFIATRALGHGTNGEPEDDESVMYRSLDLMKEMARQNSDWMEIATSPQQARRIIKEGKLAIVLGLEADVFGNFKSSDCSWNDRPEDRPLVTITEENADELLESKLNEYYDYGIRQVLPIHYLSKPFGGAAVFNGATFLPQINFYENVRVRGGVSRGIAFSLYEDFSTGPAFLSLFMSYATYAARILKQDEESEISMVNADGLTPVGQRLFTKLMEKHFIVDQEHGSYLTKDGIFAIAASKNNYPVMASHVDPEGLSFKWNYAPVRWAGAYSPSGIRQFNSNRDNIRNFGTSTIRCLSHEMELTDDNYRSISASGGTIGVFLLLNRKRTYHGSYGSVPDDCSGSSKSFAQMYLHSLDKMNGHGVGLASDLPMVTGMSPRFGVYSAWGLTMEEDDQFKVTQRTAERYAQTHGVRYDQPSRSYNHELFEGGSIPGWEEDAWKALAASDADVNPWVDPSRISDSGEIGHGDRIRNLAKGLFATDEDQLLQPGPFTGDAPWEQAAMYCLKESKNPDELTVYSEGDIHSNVTRLYNQLAPIFQLWKEKNGGLDPHNPPNEPLRRYVTGNRYWDFNLDGLAHFGLVPDMLQDAKNVGLTPLQLVPLFGSAEDYLKMWEKANR